MLSLRNNFVCDHPPQLCKFQLPLGSCPTGGFALPGIYKLGFERDPVFIILQDTSELQDLIMFFFKYQFLFFK